MQRPTTVEEGIELFPAETPTLPPATHTNSYALGSREVLLVEPATPYESERRQWLAWARSLSTRGQRLTGILLTHHHVDHVGGAEFFARELDVPLFAHDLTAERLSTLRVDRRLREGDSLILDGPVPQRWTVFHTPGHAPGHLCLFEAALGELIVGDMVASRGTIIVAPDEGDMQEYLAQLDRLRALSARVALPAHGDPITDPAGLISYYIEHRLYRERKVQNAVSGHPEGITAAEMLPDVYDDTPKAVFPLAALSLAAHLVKLVREGRVTTDGERYFPASD